MSCEHCGKLELRNKLKKKRFCSLQCAKAPKEEANTQQQKSTTNEDDGRTSSASQLDNAPMDTSTSSVNEVASSLPEIINPVINWTVREVCKFVADVLGTDEYTEDFTNQEIDGSALVLLKEKHLVNAMGMKLGPALKIVNKVQLMQGTEIEAAQATSVANVNQ